MKNSKFVTRLLTGLLATIVAVSTVFGGAVSTYAAPIGVNTDSATETTYVNVTAVDNEKVAQEALDAYEKALNDNSNEELQEALKYISSLTPTQRVHLFLLLYKNYYKLHFLDAGFPYFNVAAYMMNYPEVVGQYANLSGNALYEAVLNDYLENGIFEGKSSCTDFDPVIAILAYPQTTFSALTVGNDNSGNGLYALYNAYAAAEGSTSTSQYKIASDFLGQKCINTGNAVDFNNLFLVKDVVSPAIPYSNTNNTSTNETNSENKKSPETLKPSDPVVTPGDDTPSSPTDNPSSEDDSTDPEMPEGGEGGDGISDYSPVNKAASKKQVDGFVLYSTDQDKINNGKYVGTSTVTVLDKSEDAEEGSTIDKSVNVTFDAQLYNTISNGNDRKAKAKNTVLIYMYGTDLETNGGSETYSICEILNKKYNPEDLNIVIATGATKKYGNEWMNENSGEFKCNYYYVDPSAVTEDMRGSDCTSVEAINSNTLKLLGSYGTADFGDSSLLAGFIDMTADLFSAEQYMIVFNDHGAGINGGIGSPDDGAEDYNQTVISMDEIEEGIASSNFILDGDWFSFIGFDACLMGGVETAYNMAKYGRYMLGCEEVEVGSWDYKDLVENFENSNSETIRDDVVNFAKENSKKHADTKDVIQSFVVFNLNHVGYTADKIGEIGDAMNGLYDFKGAGDEDDTNELKKDVYFAMRSARARSYAGGSNDRDNLFEYVDMYDYLSKVRDALIEVSKKDKWAHNEEVQLEIEKSLRAISDLISNEDSRALEYVGIRYNNETIYDVDVNTIAGADENLLYRMISLNQRSKSAEYWDTFKDSNLCGASIYMPYYSAMPEGDGRYDAYIKQNLIDNYTKLVNSYVNYKNSDENIARLNRLKGVLAKKYEAEDGSKHYNYSEMIDTANIKADVITKTDSDKLSYISIPFNKEYIEAKKDEEDANEFGYNATVIENDSINPYTDFTEVVQNMNIYMLMDQTVIIDGEKQNVDLVIGRANVKNDAITGGTEKVNIVLATYKAYHISGNKANDESGKIYKEYALAQVLDQQMAKLFPDKDASKLIMFVGDATVANTNTEESNATVYENTYAVYEKTSDDSGICKLLGTIRKASEDEGYENINDIDSFKFYQYVAGDENTPFKYSQEATDASWEYDMKNSQPTVEYVDIKVEPDKYEVEFVLDIPNEEVGTDCSGLVVKVDSPNAVEHDETEEPTTFIEKVVEPDTTPNDDTSLGESNSQQESQGTPIPGEPEDTGMPADIPNSEQQEPTTTGQGESAGDNTGEGDGGSEGNGESGEGGTDAGSGDGQTE